MGQDISTKEALSIGTAAAAASYNAGFASGKLSGEQYAKGYQAAVDRSNS